ncbi:hypothetical protein AB0J38_16620 [Streptomyces sp. NPDC050095]|uniref:hypothetical protein n=1 Tax=unclassified Streptomyces TaxID=2593676 RepID=UPI00343F2E18
MHRRTRYARLSTALALIDDARLHAAVAAADTGVGSGMGGRTGVLDVEGTTVFVKRIPLTARELSPRHRHSTANLFELPAFYHYGIGSAGFGAWRELALHLMTTNWVLSDAYDGFPLTYHWRVLPDGPPQGFMDELGGIDGAVAHWDGSPAVRRRLEELAAAEHSLVLFLEYVPETVGAWLAARRTGAAYAKVVSELARGTAFLREQGVVHFDAHFDNLLTDGERILFADLGLALSSRFPLDAAEGEFLAEHLPSYDFCMTLSHLRRHHLPAGAPDSVSALLAPHASRLSVFDDFVRGLVNDSRRTPYPGRKLAQATT